MNSDTSSPLAMIGALAGVATLAGILVVLVFQLTLPYITANKAAALQKAIYEVVPNAHQVVSFLLDDQGQLQPITADDKRLPFLYAVFTDAGNLAGVALEAVGQGYQETIKVLYGYDIGLERIVGFKVLESKETPGLGDKIEKDPGFAQNFKALDVRLSENQSKLRRSIVTVKSGEKTDPWQIDGITGATISSQAIGRILNQSANNRLPVIAQNASRLSKGEHVDRHQ